MGKVQKLQRKMRSKMNTQQKTRVEIREHKKILAEALWMDQHQV